MKTTPKPPKGYRWVKRNEHLKDGDQFHDSEEGWENTEWVGSPCQLKYSYRRKLAPPRQPRKKRVSKAALVVWLDLWFNMRSKLNERSVTDEERNALAEIRRIVRNARGQ